MAHQGLNFIVANLLRWMGEEEAFWTVVQVVEVLQPKDYYTNMVSERQLCPLLSHMSCGV